MYDRTKLIRKCLRCGYVWFSRKEKLPIRCAKCKSPYWNKPRQEKKKEEETSQ